ncbi:hypothetical protein [Mucilaginibacter sp. OK283]|uniref:hypothetical protein n=1 Tax=Mucilaginibacter sp. OK283 TaxID=1881049 RepID=UPI0008C8EFB6|nr:hypothetical protein [Mucilaginibacter sp. OK283]SEO25088.1 hypothetical protein SAMN05428947_101894 [Mucilaginibacter sp. OK283]
MNFFPFENLVILTPHQPAEVEAILQKVVKPRRESFESWKVYHKDAPLYIGDVYDMKFRFQRPRYHDRNDTLVVKGVIQSENNESQLSLKIFPSAIIVFPIIMFLGWEAAFISIANSSADNFSRWLPFIFPMGAYFLFIVLFKYAVSGVRTTLLKLMNGKLAKR